MRFSSLARRSIYSCTFRINLHINMALCSCSRNNFSFVTGVGKAVQGFAIMRAGYSHVCWANFYYNPIGFFRFETWLLWHAKFDRWWWESVVFGTDFLCIECTGTILEFQQTKADKLFENLFVEWGREGWSV